MKTMIGLMMALGLVSSTALAQVHSTPQPAQETDTAPTSGGSASSPSTSQSGSGANSSSDASSGASNGMQSEAGMELRQPPSPVAQLKPVTQDDVTYLCGGVGEDEEAYMKTEAKGYDLMLTFATRDGAYLADVDVDIKDAKGNSVLQAACDSPIMLVDLPRSGNYRVRAETAGYTLNTTVRVTAAKQKGRSLASAVLSWPQRVAEAGAETSTGSSGTGSSMDSDSGTGSSTGSGTR
jgi:hypothetical protein